jgi:beta-galactosidase
MKVEEPGDTYIDTSALRKGEMWMNDLPLGRFWYVGPQFALFTPASWLKKPPTQLHFSIWRAAQASTWQRRRDRFS